MPAVLTMVSHGDIADGEIAQLHNICGFSPIFAGVDAAKLVAMINAVLGALKTQGADAVTKSAQARLTIPMRETALLSAVRIALGVLVHWSSHIVAPAKWVQAPQKSAQGDWPLMEWISYCGGWFTRPGYVLVES